MSDELSQDDRELLEAELYYWRAEGPRWQREHATVSAALHNVRKDREQWRARAELAERDLRSANELSRALSASREVFKEDAAQWREERGEIQQRVEELEAERTFFKNSVHQIVQFFAFCLRERMSSLSYPDRFTESLRRASFNEQPIYDLEITTTRDRAVLTFSRRGALEGGHE